MTHNDRLWVAASATAIMGLLRGGEFLMSKKQGARPLLTHDRVTIVSSGGSRYVQVLLDRPKATWWVPEVHVRCYSPGRDCPVDPVLWVALYRQFSTVTLQSGQAAFRLANGAPLTRDWMVARTRQRMADAGIMYVDRRGFHLQALASSWRCGGVVSAREAGISDLVIRALGRWASDAWLAYAGSATQVDLLRAARQMWQAAGTEQSQLSHLRGGLASAVIPEEGDPRQELHAVAAHQATVSHVGRSISTKWGTALVMRVFPNGDLDCSWPPCEDCYRLSLCDGLAEDDIEVTEVGAVLDAGSATQGVLL
jgi:hypothetical protein